MITTSDNIHILYVYVHTSRGPKKQFLSLGQEDPLKKEMATPSSILAWKIPQTEEPDRLYIVHGSQRVKHD